MRGFTKRDIQCCFSLCMVSSGVLLCTDNCIAGFGWPAHVRIQNDRVSKIVEQNSTLGTCRARLSHCVLLKFSTHLQLSFFTVDEIITRIIGGDFQKVHFASLLFIMRYNYLGNHYTNSETPTSLNYTHVFHVVIWFFPMYL